jgi:hypothetical protein
LEDAVNADYEKGYKDGESSGYADWTRALTEEFDLGDEEIQGPQHFLELLRAHYSFEKRAVS